MPAESPDKLIAAIDGLSGEVRMLRDVIEEFRVCFEWAVQNDRLGGRAEAGQAANGHSPDDPVREELAALTAVVQELRGVVERVVPKARRTFFTEDEPEKR